MPITHTVTIYQMLRTGDTETYSPTVAYSNIDAVIMPLSTNIQMSLGIPAFTMFEAFFFDKTLLLTNGDKIVDQNSIDYILDGEAFVMDIWPAQFIKCVIRKAVIQ